MQSPMHGRLRYENEGEFKQIIAEADNNMYQVKAMRKKNAPYKIGRGC